jgi:hypothetical protein
VAADGPTIKASVLSRSDSRFRNVSLEEPWSGRDVSISYPDAICGCEDSYWASGKRKRSISVCAHIAALEIALHEDDKTQRSQDKNITGLYPSERWNVPHLPFTFNFFKSENELNPSNLDKQRALMGILVRYYAFGLSQTDVSIEALRNPVIYSKKLVEAILNSNDRARFEIVRQREERVSKENLTDIEDRRYASVTTLIGNITKYLDKVRNCYFGGYSLEFVGTKWQTVARRFEPRGNGPSYAIVTSKEHPPIIVGHTLEEKSQNWLDSSDKLQTEHIWEKVGIKPYRMIDDVTRRTGYVQLILPDAPLKEHGFYIPENLQKEYDSLRAKTANK